MSFVCSQLEQPTFPRHKKQSALASVFQLLKLEALSSPEWRQVLFDLERSLHENSDRGPGQAYAAALQSRAFASFMSYLERLTKSRIYLDSAPAELSPSDRLAECLSQVLTSLPAGVASVLRFLPHPNAYHFFCISSTFTTTEFIRLLHPMLNRSITQFQRYPQLRASLWLSAITSTPEVSWPLCCC